MEKYLISLEDAIALVNNSLKEGYLEWHEDSYDSPIPVGRMNFADFIKDLEDFDGEDDGRIYKTNYPLINVLNVYDFETKRCSNYHHVYSNGVSITLHQLDYGIDIPDISDGNELIERLFERIEFAQEDFLDEWHRIQFGYLFSDILELFFHAIECIFQTELDRQA